MNVNGRRPGNASNSGDDASSVSCDAHALNAGKKRGERERTYEVLVLHEGYDI